MVKDLLFVPPETEGLASERILEFLQSIQELNINLHSFMLVRNGKILSEGYYKPIDVNFNHRLYSCSKTFVSLAIGLLVTEGKIKVTDKLLDYFPEYKEHNKDCEWMQALTIEQVLTMTVSGIDDSYSDEGVCTHATAPTALRMSGWVDSFFTYKNRNAKPNGMMFSYNTSAAYILNVLVERVVGKPFLEYMRPLFDKIGVSKDIKCVLSPDGYSWGGSGVICTLRDFAKVGELLLNKGEVNGEQLISKEYMEKAISKVVDTTFHGYESYYVGYGYQLWITTHGFALRGLGGQLVYGFPDKNFMFVCQADLYGAIDYFEVPLYYEVVEKLYDAIGDEKTINKAMYAKLKQTEQGLTLLCDFGENTSEFAEKINGVKYNLEKNDMGISCFSLLFNENYGKLVYENSRGVKEIPFGYNRFVEFEFPETHYYDMQICREGGRKQRAIAGGGWTMPNRLVVQTNIIDNSIGHIGMTFEFFGDEVAVKFVKMAEAYLGEYCGYAYGKTEKKEK